METKRVYTFGNGKAEGKADMRNLLGGKGANLAEMNLIGVPVPPGFTITTDVCNEYFEKDGGVAARRCEESCRTCGDADELQVWRRGKPVVSLRALRRTRLDAGHDGHDPQPRTERRSGGRPDPQDG